MLSFKSQLIVLFTEIVLSSCEEVAILPGDLTIGGLFSIRYPLNSSDEDACDMSRLSEYSVIELEAVKWSLKRLNDIDFVPGVRLGLLAYPTCRLTGLAGLRANDFVHLTQTSNSTYNLIGVIGPTYSSEAEVVSKVLSSMPSKYRLPQIGFTTTSASLGSHALYPNFFRTVPSDDVQIKAMASLLVELQWNRIHIIYERDTYGISGSRILNEHVTKLGICVPITSAIDIDNSTTIRSQLNNILKESSNYQIGGIVFIGGGQSGKQMIEIADSLKSSSTPGFIFSEAIGLVTDFFLDDHNKTINSSKGSLVMSPVKMAVEDFKQYWISLFTNTSKLYEESKTNPWLKELFFKFSRCPLNDASCSPMSENEVRMHLPEDVFVSYGILAAYTMAKAVHQMHTKLCSGQNGLCDKFKTVPRGQYITELKEIAVDFQTDFGTASFTTIISSLQFDENGNAVFTESSPDYEVYNHRTCLSGEQRFCLVKVAIFDDNTLSLDETKLKDYDANGEDLSRYRKDNCPVGDICHSCLPIDESSQMYYIPGDLILLATFPIHNKGTNALECGAIRPSIGLDVAMTTAYAVEKVNDKSSIYKELFPTKSIGLLLLDTCNSPLVIQDKLLSIYRSSNTLPGLPSDIKNRIIGLVGSLGSTPTLGIAEVTSDIGIPQVGCCSTTSQLNDHTRYPYFVRVSTPVDKNAVLMILIAEQLEGKYAQIIYSEGDYGESGKNALIAEAGKRSICIAQSIKVKENIEYDKILPALRKHPDARFVLLILRSHVGPPIFKLITDDTSFNVGEFQFIASETWGTRDEYQHPKLVGSITVAQEMPQSSEYESWIYTQVPKATSPNTWLQSIMERRFNCYFSWSFNKTASRQCDDNDRLPGISSQRLDPWTPYMMHAAFALLSGAHSAYTELCGDDSADGICSNYSSNPGIVIEHIKRVQLDLESTGRKIDVINEDGNGGFGYKIFNLQQTSDGSLVPEQVGSWRESVYDLKVNRLQYPSGHNIPSICSKNLKCTHCLSKKEYSCAEEQNSKTTPLLVSTIIMSALLVILTTILFCVYLKSRNKGDPIYLDPEHDYTEVTRRHTSYLNPVGYVGYDDANDIVTEDEQNINGCQAPISFTDVPIQYMESVVL